MKAKTKKDRRVQRHRRVRRKVSGSAERPRMCIVRSNRHLYVQFVDDVRGMTMASVATAGPEVRKNVAAARELGRRAAEAALQKGIRLVVVDRGGFKYHGRVKAIVEGAVASGIAIQTGAGEN